MKKRLAATITAGLGAAVAFASCETDQDTPDCVLSRSQFVIRYEPVGAVPAGCDLLETDIAGVQLFNDPTTDIDIVGIQPEFVGSGADAGVGRLAAGQPNEQNICTVADFSPSTGTHAEATGRRLPLADGGTQTETRTFPVALDYDNVDFYVTAAAQGTQVRGTVTVNRGAVPGLADGGYPATPACTAQFRFYGIAPSHSCEGEDGEPDQNACLPVADPSIGVLSGSGINPEYPVFCGAESLHCEPTEIRTEFLVPEADRDND